MVPRVFVWCVVYLSREFPKFRPKLRMKATKSDSRRTQAILKFSVKSINRNTTDDSAVMNQIQILGDSLKLQVAFPKSPCHLLSLISNIWGKIRMDYTCYTYLSVIPTLLVQPPSVSIPNPTALFLTCFYVALGGVSPLCLAGVVCGVGDVSTPMAYALAPIPNVMAPRGFPPARLQSPTFFCHRQGGPIKIASLLPGDQHPSALGTCPLHSPTLWMTSEKSRPVQGVQH